MYEYRATILRWLDGDTAELEIDLGLRIYHRLMIRLAGIDTPEKNSPDQSKRIAAALARDRAAELCPVGSAVTVSTEKPDSRDKFGRWLGHVRFDAGGAPRDLTDVLISEGHGRPYDGGKR